MFFFVSGNCQLNQEGDQRVQRFRARRWTMPQGHQEIHLLDEGVLYLND